MFGNKDPCSFLAATMKFVIWRGRKTVKWGGLSSKLPGHAVQSGAATKHLMSSRLIGIVCLATMCYSHWRRCGCNRLAS